MTSKIYAIHGAFSTPKIFSYLQSKLSDYEWKFLDYSTETSNILDIMKGADTLNENQSDSHVIGHSMGGLFALYMAEKPWVKSITTIATPLGGLDLNIAQVYLSRSNFLSDISTTSKFVKDIHNKKYSVPVMHVLSTSGFNPYMTEANDGVVSVRCQKAWSCGTIREVKSNHSEIMLDNATVDNLIEFWRQIE